MLSRDQEIELLEQDIQDAERRLRSLERAPFEGRWTRGATDHMDACANQNMRLVRLNLDLADLQLAEALEEELA